MIKYFVFAIILLLSEYVGAQSSINCSVKLPTKYIQDGQSYSIELDESAIGKIYITFQSGFDYRLQFCSSTVKDYRIKIFDIEKKELVSNICNNYEKSINIRFKSDIACVIEIECIDKNVIKKTKPIFNFVVGIKDNGLNK